MSIKPTIYEKCERCGQRAATLRDERLKLRMAVRDVEQAIRPFREHKEFPNE